MTSPTSSGLSQSQRPSPSMIIHEQYHTKSVRSPASIYPSSASTPSAVRGVDIQSLYRMDQLLTNLQTIHHDNCNHHYQTQTTFHQLEQVFYQHIQTLHRLWNWGEENKTTDLPSFSEWLDTPVEATLTALPSADILSGINALDTQILMQHGWKATHAPLSKPRPHPKEPLGSSKSQDNDAMVRAPIAMKRTTDFQALLQDLLGHVDECKRLLTQGEVIQERSRQTDHAHEQRLQYTEDLLTLSRMQSLDALYQQIYTYVHEHAQAANIAVNLLIPEKDPHIWIDHYHHGILLQAVCQVLDQWLTLQTPTPQPATPSVVAPTSTITLTSHLRRQALIIELKETPKQAPNGHRQPTTIDLTTLQASLAEIDRTLIVLEPSEERESHLPLSTPYSSNHTHLMIQTPLPPIQFNQLVCRVKDQFYGIPIQDIEHLILPKTDQLKMSTDGVLMLKWPINHQKEYLRVYSLSQLIQYSKSSTLVGQHHRPSHPSASNPPISTSNPHHPHAVSSPPPSPQPSCASPLPILILQIDQQWMGIMVDEVIEEKMVLIRPLSRVIASPSWIYGCALVNDDQLALSLDLSMLLQHAVGLGV